MMNLLYLVGAIALCIVVQLCVAAGDGLPGADDDDGAADQPVKEAVPGR